MKKAAALIVSTLTVLSCVSVCAVAAPETDQKLPFALEAPQQTSLSWLGGEADSPTSLQFAYSMNNSMNEWLSKVADPDTHDAALEELHNQYGLEELFVSLQIDWAIDDPESGWHYTKYWDGETYTDEEGEHWAGLGNDRDYRIRCGDWDAFDIGVGAQTVNTAWILRGNVIVNDPAMDEEARKTANEWFYGNDLIPGLKNQLKDNQYTLLTVPDSTEQQISIDWTQHTAYARARWAVILRTEERDRVVFSDWSAAAASGKDAAAYVPYTKETLSAPVIKDLDYYPEDFNGYPQITCTLEVPDELSANLTHIEANGGSMSINWEARVPDGQWVQLQGDFTITAGKHIIALQNLAEALAEENGQSSGTILKAGSPVELRCRYYCVQYERLNGEYLGDFDTDYSAVLTFGTEELNKEQQTPPDESSVAEDSKKSPDEHKCKICGFCPEPLGLCIFIWLAIVVVIVVIVIIVIVSKKKKDKKGE